GAVARQSSRPNVAPHQKSETGDPLDGPAHAEAADEARPGAHRHAIDAQLSQAENQPQHREDEQELTRFDADVEERERRRRLRRRHAETAEDACKAEAMYETERGRDADAPARFARRARVARRTAGSKVQQGLARHERDRERDERLDGPGRDAQDAV